MRSIVKTPHHSWRIGALPAGCRFCVRGAKTVLLVTGLCSRGCWYCPLSARKRGRDVVVANEWWVEKDADVLREAELCDSLGAGITGGDPLRRLERTVKYLRMLKRRFGGNFHIHLYTSGELATVERLKMLNKAGLDEIRFHPDFLKQDFRRSIGLENALKFGWDVGCEIPVIPGKLGETKRLIDYINKIGVAFLNLNELEISETNAASMEKRGFTPAGEISFAVKGSRETAMKLLRYCAKNTKLKVHYCTVMLKDGVQLRNRLERRARNVAKDYDVVTNEGLLYRGAIYLPKLSPSFDYGNKIKGIKGLKRIALVKKLKAKARILSNEFEIPKELIEVDERKLRILTGAWIIEEIAKEIKSLGLSPAVVEEYPTWDGLCVDMRML
ncbi:MAG: radical SAM protein [Candidatus Altiarchaeota archaeon]|nr:radical SAM protein [Candidatus Altiarchaeota archaeon]